MASKNSVNIIKQNIEEKLTRYFGVVPADATQDQLYKAVSMTVVDLLLEQKRQFNAKMKQQNLKRVYYLCMEFLVGRSLKTNLYNLGLVEDYRSVLNEYNVDLNELYEMEPDAGLGNGGLGRLAACFMDSLAALNYPAMGFSLRYEYGLFNQKIVDDLAKYSDVPVWNGLTDEFHPTQMLADFLTIKEHFRGLKGNRVTCIPPCGA